MVDEIGDVLGKHLKDKESMKMLGLTGSVLSYFQVMIDNVDVTETTADLEYRNIMGEAFILDHSYFGELDRQVLAGSLTGSYYDAGNWSSTYTSAVQPSDYFAGSLVGYWKFDTNRTTAYDSSENKNDGTITGATWMGTGKIGGVYDFDGSGDYVDCGSDTSLNITNAITVSGWFNGEPGDTEGQLIGKGTSEYPPYEIFMSSDRKIHVEGSSSGTGSDYTIISSAISVGWHHFAMTFSTDVGMILYIDGVNAGSDTTKTALKSTAGESFLIGAQYPT